VPCRSSTLVTIGSTAEGGTDELTGVDGVC